MMPSVNHMLSTPMRWVILIIGLVIGFVGVVLMAPPSSLAQGDATPTPTPTIVPTLIRPTVVSTGLPTIGGPTRTRTRVSTSTHIPSATMTRTNTPTHTRTQTASPTSSLTATQRASDTFTPFPTNTLVATTLAATSTNTAIVTQAIVPSSVNTLTSTASPTNTATYTPTVTVSPSATLTHTPTPTITASMTATETPTSTPTATLTATPTPTATNTTTRVPAVVESSRPADTSTNDNGGTSPLVFLAGIVLTGLIGGYIVMFATSQAAAERYAGGFVIQYCPVCYEGRLYMEERSNRVLGILRIRRTVRCDNCRSVLREVGKHRWRYAVDRTVSPEMYASLNNRLLREEQLVELAPQDATQSPEYFEDAPDEF